MSSTMHQWANHDDLLAIAIHSPLPPSPVLAPSTREGTSHHHEAETIPSAAVPLVTTSTEQEKEQEQTYRVKEILFSDAHLFPNTHTNGARRDSRVRILMQNANGPCPLLAIANVLALRGDLVIPLGEPTVTYSFLAHRLGEYLLSAGVSLSPPASPTSAASSSSSSQNPAVTLDHILTLLPTLQHGVTINPRFDHVFSIDTAADDPAPLLFSAFHIPLVHGWTCDPQDTLAWSVLGPHGPGRSFNQASLLAVADPPTPASHIARDFLATTVGQLTVHGLVTLATAIDTGLYALFRNNHFYVMYKRAAGELYTLVTDEGYVDVPGVVWETFEAVDGESKMCTGEFSAWDPQAEQRQEPRPEASDQVPLALLGVGRHVDAGSMVGTLSSRAGTVESAAQPYLALAPQPAGFESEQERADREYALALQQAEDAAATLPVTSPRPGSTTHPSASPSRRPSASPEARAQQSAPVYMDPRDVVAQTRPATAPAGAHKKAKGKDCLIM